MIEKPQTSPRDIPHLPTCRFATPVAVLLVAIGLSACSTSSESGREDGGGEGPGEHDLVGETGEGGETDEGGGEESPTEYALADSFYMTRAGARLELRYDSATEAFTGTVTNISGAPLSTVRVEVHLSNGVELGPTLPVDLAPGRSIPVTLDATGQTFATWGAHPEVGSEGEGTGMAAFTPALGSWATVDGVDLGIEHPAHRMSAWYTQRSGVWTPHLDPAPAPEHQPTGAAIWTGEWAGYHGSSSTISTGAASVIVTIGAATEATLALESVPTLGTLQWDAMPVNDGRFKGDTTTHSQTYNAEGQFAGSNQAGVVGHASGSDFRSVFYGDKN